MSDPTMGNNPLEPESSHVPQEPGNPNQQNTFTAQQGQQVPAASLMPNTVPSPRKKPVNKGLIIGLSVGGGVLLIAVIVIGIFMLQSRTTAEDYVDATKKVTQIYTALSSVGSDSYNLLSDTLSEELDQDEVSKATKDIDSGVAKLSSRIKEFTGLRAFKDEEVKNAYDKFAQDLNNFHSYTDGIIQIIPVHNDFKKACSNVGDTIYLSYSNAGDALTKLDTCHSAASALSEVDNKDFAEFGKSYDAQLVEMQDILKQLKSFGDDIYTDAAKYEQYSALQSKLSDYNLYNLEFDFSQTVLDKLKDLNPTGALEDLRDTISDQALE